MTKHWGKRASFFFLQRNVFLWSWLPLPTHPVVVFTLVCLVYKCFVAASETQTFIHFNPAETRTSRYIARCCFSSSWFLAAFTSTRSMHLLTVFIWIEVRISQILQLPLFIYFSGRHRLRHIEIRERENRQWKRCNRRGIPLVIWLNLHHHSELLSI